MLAAPTLADNSAGSYSDRWTRCSKHKNTYPLLSLPPYPNPRTTRGPTPHRFDAPTLGIALTNTNLGLRRSTAICPTCSLSRSCCCFSIPRLHLRRIGELYTPKCWKNRLETLWDALIKVDLAHQTRRVLENRRQVDKFWPSPPLS
jgi:hypothetical protein